MKINKEIIDKLRMNGISFSVKDIRKFDRTSQQAQKAIRCWKKNNLIKSKGWNKYDILDKNVENKT